MFAALGPSRLEHPSLRGPAKRFSNIYVFFLNEYNILVYLNLFKDKFTSSYVNVTKIYHQ
jgi:hypothetical protein